MTGSREHVRERVTASELTVKDGTSVVAESSTPWCWLHFGVVSGGGASYGLDEVRSAIWLLAAPRSFARKLASSLRALVRMRSRMRRPPPLWADFERAPLRA